eukprot:TRINITY_DN1326_c0_g1_i1.p1 TRINITY_DN1326_c0_g1~~TRINITY_DN1326_c0_g1_i1.p1  ORF type:complete len:209 (-),score=27.36 TRINITY_DN1326_c0_g1_i1:593-1219(-)
MPPFLSFFLVLLVSLHQVQGIDSDIDLFLAIFTTPEEISERSSLRHLFQEVRNLTKLKFEYRFFLFSAMEENEETTLSLTKEKKNDQDLIIFLPNSSKNKNSLLLSLTLSWLSRHSIALVEEPRKGKLSNLEWDSTTEPIFRYKVVCKLTTEAWINFQVIEQLSKSLEQAADTNAFIYGQILTGEHAQDQDPVYPLTAYLPFPSSHCP